MKGKSKRCQAFSISSPLAGRIPVGGVAPGGKGPHPLSPSAFALNLAAMLPAGEGEELLLVKSRAVDACMHSI